MEYKKKPKEEKRLIRININEELGAAVWAKAKALGISPTEYTRFVLANDCKDLINKNLGIAS